MTASTLQVVSADDAFAGGTTLTTPAFPANATIGSTLEAWVTGGSVAANTFIDSAGQSYTKKQFTFDGSAGQSLSLWVFPNNQSATKLTGTVTFGLSQAGKGIIFKEIGGVTTTGFDTSTPVAADISPGTGANAITTAAATPTNAPAYCSSVAMECSVGDGSDLVAESGSASDGTFWPFGGAAVLAKSASKRIATAVSTTFKWTAGTNGASGHYLVGMAFYDEASGGGATGVGAAADGHDTVAGSGSQSTSGSGAAADGHDTVAGTGSAARVGVGAAADGHDTVSGSGSAARVGVGAAADGHDTVSGAGTGGASGASGSGAAADGHDTVAGSGSQSTSGAGAAADGHDTVTGSGAQSTSGSGAAADGHDTVAGTGSVPPTLATWRSILAAVKAGTRRARLMTIGDSVTAGENSTGNAMGSNALSLSYPVQMAPLFSGAPAHQDSWFSNYNAASDSATLDQYDFRITLGSGWAADTSNPTLAGYPIIGPASSAVLAFTPLNSFDNFTIWFEKFSGSPQYTVNVDGGTSLGTLAMNAAAGIGVANFTVAPGTHTINIVSNGSSGGKIFGCEAWSSTSPRVQVFTAGADSWTAGDWTQNNGNAWDPLAMAEFLAPDLSLVCLGKNEQAQGISQATFEANLRTLVTGLLAAGSAVVIWGPPLSNPSGLPTNMSEAAQLAYETNMANVASSLGCTFYSLTQSRANWGSFAAANSAGFMFTGDDIHLTPAGYLDVATALLSVIDSGSAAITDGHDTVVGVGGQSTSGSGAALDGHDTVAGSGASGVSGSGAETNAPDVVAGSGSQSTSGSGAAADGHDTVGGSGAQSTSGSGAAVNAPDVVAGSGGSGASGTGTATNAPDVATGSGAQSTSGSGAAANAPDAAAGAGSQSTSGSGAAADGHDTVAGSGASGASGSGAETNASDVVAGSGAQSTTAAGAAQDSPDIVVGAGAQSTSGSGAAADGHDTVAGSGVSGASGSGAAADGHDTVAASGAQTTSGTGAAANASDTVAGIGASTPPGTGAAVNAPDTVSGAGSQSVSGAGAAANAPDKVSGTGSTPSTGEVFVIEIVVEAITPISSETDSNISIQIEVETSVSLISGD